MDARQELDLKVGVAFTRFQTRFFQGKYGDLDSTVISYGPCQTPTLSFCVERHDRIQAFQPESFWSVATTIKKSDMSVKLSWLRERIFDRQVATMFVNMVHDAKTHGAKYVCPYQHMFYINLFFSRVLNINVQKKSKSRPHALNTVTFS